MPQNATAHSQLADEMDRRRIELRLRWEEIADRARISATHLRKFRRGDAGLSALALANLEEALLWEPGSIDAILSGQEPTVARQDAGVAPEPVRAQATVHQPSPTTSSTRKSLGEILVERNLARPEELTSVDEIRNDSFLVQLLQSPDYDEPAKDRMLLVYRSMRQAIQAPLERDEAPASE